MARIDKNSASGLNMADIETNIVALEDGITAPSATVGLAKIYVDMSDGDLKVVFGDGTVVTIVADTVG